MCLISNKRVRVGKKDETPTRILTDSKIVRPLQVEETQVEHTPLRGSYSAGCLVYKRAGR